MITVYHNTRCSKSRSAVQLLEEKGIPFQLHLYMTDRLTIKALKELLKKLGMKPHELLRKNEALYKELKETMTTDAAWLSQMVAHPQLIERPIVVNGDKAVVARPEERVLEIL